MMTFVERLQAAIAAQDRDALVALLAETPAAPDHDLAKVALEQARALPKELCALRIVLYDLAMSAAGASTHAFNSALHFLGVNAGDPAITHDLIRAWLARGVPHGPANPYIFHNAACLYVTLGEHAEAIRMCAGAVLYQYDKLPKLLADTDLEVLWTDPRYQEIVARGVERKALRAAYAAQPPLPSSERNAELEAAIAAEPDAPGPYLVYADWLQERGDPRGELITLSHAGRAEAFQAHLAAHRRALLGELAVDTSSHDGRFQAMELTWHLGFIRRALFRYAAYSTEDRHVPPIAELVQALFASQAGRFVRELALGVTEPGESHRAALRELFAVPHPLIHTLTLCEFKHEDSELSWVELDELDALWSALPGLEHLTIRAGQFSFGTIVAPRLRDFRIYTSGLPRETVLAICAGTLPALERLEVWFGSETYGATATVEDLAPLLDASRFPKVTHLALANAEFTNALCDVLPEASILPRLRVLDLSKGTMTSTGLQALLDARDRFAHLDVLDLSENHLIGELDPEVATLAKQVIIGDQREPFDDGDPYVAIGE